MHHFARLFEALSGARRSSLAQPWAPPPLQRPEQLLNFRTFLAVGFALPGYKLHIIWTTGVTLVPTISLGFWVPLKRPLKAYISLLFAWTAWMESKRKVCRENTTKTYHSEELTLQVTIIHTTNDVNHSSIIHTSKNYPPVEIAPRGSPSFQGSRPPLHQDSLPGHLAGCWRGCAANSQTNNKYCSWN